MLQEEGRAVLGVLSALKVREVWPDEAKDFTPWLAGEADMLGEALGMDLVHWKTEAGVGGTVPISFSTKSPRGGSWSWRTCSIPPTTTTWAS